MSVVVFHPQPHEIFSNIQKKNHNKIEKSDSVDFKQNQIFTTGPDRKKNTIVLTKIMKYFYALKANKKHTAENENYFSDFHTQTLAQCQKKLFIE